MKKREHLNRKLRHSDRSLILLSLPTVLWYICFCYLPLFGIIMAFKKYRLVPGKGFLYSLFAGSKWVGLDNFRYLFMNPQMGTVIRNTVLYNLIFLALDLVLPVALAIALSYLRSGRLRSAVQTASMLPHFLSWMIVSYFAFAFLSTDRGLEFPAEDLWKAGGGMVSDAGRLAMAADADPRMEGLRLCHGAVLFLCDQHRPIAV